MDWKISNKRVGPYPAIEHRKTNEVCIASKYGEIWPYDNSGNYKAVVKSTSIAKKVGKYLKQYLVDGLADGSEALFKFNEQELPQVAKIMRMHKQRKPMLKHAENF